MKYTSNTSDLNSKLYRTIVFIGRVTSKYKYQTQNCKTGKDSAFYVFITVIHYVFM